MERREGRRAPNGGTELAFCEAGGRLAFVAELANSRRSLCLLPDRSCRGLFLPVVVIIRVLSRRQGFFLPILCAGMHRLPSVRCISHFETGVLLHARVWTFCFSVQIQSAFLFVACGIKKGIYSRSV